MEFFLPEEQDPHLKRLPPEEVRILSLGAEPYPDGRRLRVSLEITPFETRPHLEVTLRDPQGEEVSTVSLVEPMAWKLEFTMHLRGAKTAGEYTLLARLYYPPPLDPDRPQPINLDVPDTDRREVTIPLTPQP
ncbi:MAG: hypothetical protein D6770_02090 [Anaerolineae bacterium]|nr:MAG: hypothetical protein D6770_02090 [Anaerolineae bacterium]